MSRLYIKSLEDYQPIVEAAKRKAPTEFQLVDNTQLSDDIETLHNLIYDTLIDVTVTIKHKFIGHPLPTSLLVVITLITPRNSIDEIDQLSATEYLLDRSLLFIKGMKSLVFRLKKSNLDLLNIQVKEDSSPRRDAGWGHHNVELELETQKVSFSIPITSDLKIF